MVSTLVYINTNKKNNHPCFKIPCYPYEKRVMLFSPNQHSHAISAVAFLTAEIILFCSRMSEKIKNCIVLQAT